MGKEGKERNRRARGNKRAEAPSSLDCKVLGSQWTKYYRWWVPILSSIILILLLSVSRVLLLDDSLLFIYTFVFLIISFCFSFKTYVLRAIVEKSWRKVTCRSYNCVCVCVWCLKNGWKWECLVTVGVCVVLIRSADSD